MEGNTHLIAQDLNMLDLLLSMSYNVFFLLMPLIFKQKKAIWDHSNCI